MDRKFLAIPVIILFAVLVAAVIILDPITWIFTPTDSSLEKGLTAGGIEYEVMAEDLEVPWEVLVLDEDRFLVTERTGDLILFEDGEREVVESFDNIYGGFMGEGGLLGMALHPDFEDNQYLYVYMTIDEGTVENQVLRYTFNEEENTLEDEEVIIDGIPSDRIHNGGRIQFGPDGMLYITTGDAAEPELAQDTGSLAGKILRLDDDGSIQEDNPFDNEVYSYGHRNPQGITWVNGEMWSTEHGATARDELNLVESGLNYGWPEIEGDETHPEMETPVVNSGTDETWAPAGATSYDDSIFFAGLRGESLYQAEISGEGVNLTRHLTGDFGRLRGVTLHNDMLYITTSNADGRGKERPGDDRIIRIDVEEFE